VPSLDDALLELELQPLHDAIRAGDEQAALDAVADLIGGAPPAITTTEEPTDKGLARSIETLVAVRQPEMASGKWIYDWLLNRVWPHADLMALMLDLEARPKTSRANGKRPAELLADDRFQRSIGVNEHDGKSYFNKERFVESVEWLALPDAAELTAAAAKARYRLDDLRKLLAEPPKWASTTPARPTPRSTPAKPAAKAADSVPPKPVAGARQATTKQTRKTSDS
jgi:hypothetical protein